MGDVEGYRKIELQSPQDLSFLIANFRKSITQHMNTAFPPVEGGDGHGEDELRVQIERMMEEWVQRTVTLAAPNLSINGNESVDPTPYLAPNISDLAAQEPEERYEQFDARKRQRYHDLAGQEQDLLQEIASLKKRVPVGVATQWSDKITRGMKEDQEIHERVKEEVVARTEGQQQVDANEGAKTKKRKMLGDVKLERREEVEVKFGEVVGTLGRLKRDMPATVAKMERARVAGSYVVTGK